MIWGRQEEKKLHVTPEVIPGSQLSPVELRDEENSGRGANNDGSATW